MRNIALKPSQKLVEGGVTFPPLVTSHRDASLRFASLAQPRPVDWSKVKNLKCALRWGNVSDIGYLN